jgi:glycosyltransferase involved in cell wall biosynthesis
LKKLKVIAIPHLVPSMNVGNSEIISITESKFTRFNDSNQFWFYSLGNHLMNQFEAELDFEIWQPDTNVHETLIRKYDNGLVYKLIPATFEKEFTLTETKKRLFSHIILNSIESEIIKNKNIVLFFRGTREHLLNKIVNRYYGRVPFVGMFSIQIIDQFKIDHFWTNPFHEIYYYFFGFRPYKKFLKKVNNIVPSTQNDLKSNPFFKKLNVFYRDDFASWGINTDFWIRIENTTNFKKRYGIKKDEKVILISSRIVEEKQVIEMIEALGNFKNENFHLIITGNLSKNKYVDQVVSLTQSLLPGKVTMTGYISDGELREVYSISDLMLSYSISEGGPFSIFQAYLMEVPVIQSSVGIAGEMALLYQISKLVDPFEPSELKNALVEYFAGIVPKPLERSIAENFFRWNRIAEYYLNIFLKINNIN